MTRIFSLFARLYERVWQRPKAKASDSVRNFCEGLEPKQRLTLVTVMLSVFILTAFFVFGHACYRIGARQAFHSIEVEHIRALDLQGQPNSMDRQPIVKQIESAYDTTGMESED